MVHLQTIFRNTVIIQAKKKKVVQMYSKDRAGQTLGPDYQVWAYPDYDPETSSNWTIGQQGKASIPQELTPSDRRDIQLYTDRYLCLHIKAHAATRLPQALLTSTCNISKPPPGPSCPTATHLPQSLQCLAFPLSVSCFHILLSPADSQGHVHSAAFSLCSLLFTVTVLTIQWCGCIGSFLTAPSPGDYLEFLHNFLQLEKHCGNDSLNF